MKRLFIIVSALVLSCTVLAGQNPAAKCKLCRQAGNAVYSLDSASIKDATAFIRPEWQSLARGLAISPAFTPTSGNSVMLISNGCINREHLFKELAAAQKSIDIEVLAFSCAEPGQEAVSILADRAANGVRVRYTHDNCSNFFDNMAEDVGLINGFYDNMNKLGIEKRDFSPLGKLWFTYYYPARRNHRKITVIDEKVVYTGGMNYSSWSLGDYGDMNIRIEGPSAACYRSIFLQNWNRIDVEKKHQELLELKVCPEDSPSPSGIILQAVPDGYDEPARMAQSALIWILDNASSYVWLRTPYLCPTKPVMDAFKRAVRRGIDVRLLLPGISDVGLMEPINRHYAVECAKRGVRVEMLMDEFNHAKVLISDDYVVCVGSSNLDKLSLKRLYEVNTYLYDSGIAEELKAAFNDSFARSVNVSPDFAKTWSLGERLSQSLLLPFDFLL